MRELAPGAALVLGAGGDEGEGAGAHGCAVVARVTKRHACAHNDIASSSLSSQAEVNSGTRSQSTSMLPERASDVT